MEAIFKINTKMTEEDYKNFLYFAVFKKKWYTIPSIFLITFIAALLSVTVGATFNFKGLIFIWFFMSVIAFGSLFLKIRLKLRKMRLSDKTGRYEGFVHLDFYDEYILIKNDGIEGEQKLSYNNFFEVYDIDKYYIFYFNNYMASIIRKCDILNVKEFSDFIQKKFNSIYKKRK